MKLSRILIVVNIFVLLVAGIIALPSINTNLFGKDIKFDSEPVKQILNGRFSNIRIGNSRDFMTQQLFILEMVGLNTEPAEGQEPLSNEDKEKAFNENFEIIKQRIEFMGMGDYTMRKVKTEDNKYYIEIKLPDNQLNSSVLGTLISQGEYIFYEYDENYEEPENPDEANMSFLDGKKPSDILNLDDAIQIKHEFIAEIEPTGGWAMNIDFGQTNVDKVALAAASSENFNDYLRRLWIVQSGIPVAVQIGPVLRDANNQAVQSNVLFASFISQEDPNSRLVSKAIVSSLKTDAVNTPITISSTQNLDPIYGSSTIENLKIFFIVGFILIALVSAIVFKMKGLVLAGSLFVQAIISIAVAKLISVNLSIALIYGILGGFIYFAVSLIYYLNIKNKELIPELDKYRKNFWLISSLLLAAGVITALTLNAILLDSILGFVIAIIASLITYEMSVKLLIELFVKSENNSSKAL